MGRKGDGGITDVDTQGVLGAKTVDERKGILTGIALDMTDLETCKVTEKLFFFLEKSRAFVAEEEVLIDLVAVVSGGGLLIAKRGKKS